MSVNPSGMDDTDYSDFEYQSASVAITAQESGDTTGGGDISLNSVAEIPVLDGQGGLDNNEVAELVYLETNATLAFNDASADQNVATSGEFEGVVGANLSPSSDSIPSARVSNGTIEVIGTSAIDESNVNTDIAGGTEDRWFQLFRCQGGPPFDDETNGLGGGASPDGFTADKPFRDLVGRGPVLDSSDDMSVASRLRVDDTIIDTIGTVRVHMVWDVAETSDAGRAFSIPK